MPRLKSLILLILLLSFSQSIAAARDWLLEVPMEGGGKFVGDAVHWNKQFFYVLGRDGQAKEFDIADAPRARKIKGNFTTFTMNEMRLSLKKEFGRAYNIQKTRHYLVVHPAGQPDLWSGRFEELYRQMVHYFTSRGISVSEPAVPLVAIVFPTQQEFREHAKEKNGMDTEGVLGYYDLFSNRIMLSDETGGRKNTHDWRETASTVVHEASHQTAFNIGVQSRWSSPSRWISEGIGTLFEARGVNNALRYRKLEDRINQKHLASFVRRFPNGIEADSIRSLVASEEGFNARPLPAYAASWAMTFMFAEKQSHKLSGYLKEVAKREVFFQPVPPRQRLSDFESFFGSDYMMLAARLNRFVDELEASNE
jgi:hypothetical protein